MITTAIGLISIAAALFCVYGSGTYVIESYGAKARMWNNREELILGAMWLAISAIIFWSCGVTLL